MRLSVIIIQLQCLKEFRTQPTQWQSNRTDGYKVPDEMKCQLSGITCFKHNLKVMFFARGVLLLFSVTPFKIDQNENRNRSIYKVHNLGNERRLNMQILAPRFRSQQFFLSKVCGESFYPTLQRFVWRRHAGDHPVGINRATGNQQKHLPLQKREIISRGIKKTLK